jgi:carbon-monoxide dehydrogenase medium subunit
VKPFAYATPTDLEEALEVLVDAGDDGHLIAGGTSVILLLKQGLIEPAVLISLARLTELTGVRVLSDAIEIGSMVSLRAIERHPDVCALLPAVAAAFGQVATVRIRNQATIGGNLVHADPAQDPPPALLVHDAAVDVRGPGGQRRIDLVDLFVDVFETSIAADEIVTRVVVPRPGPSSRAVYCAFLPRTVDDYATVSVAVRLEFAADGAIAVARIALGNAGAVPFRAPVAEAALTGAQPTPAVLAEVAALAAIGSDPGDDIRGSATYKREMVRVWTRRALEQTVAAWSRE